jgi:hypothetical protein
MLIYPNFSITKLDGKKTSLYISGYLLEPCIEIWRFLDIYIWKFGLFLIIERVKFSNFCHQKNTGPNGT